MMKNTPLDTLTMQTSKTNTTGRINTIELRRAWNASIIADFKRDGVVMRSQVVPQDGVPNEWFADWMLRDTLPIGAMLYNPTLGELKVNP